MKEHIVLLVVIILLFPISANLVLSKNFAYYSKVYKELPTYHFARYKDHIFTIKDGEPNYDFVWFTKTDDFKLADNRYLHNSVVTFSSLYAWYWWWKYKKWFKTHIYPLTDIS